MKISFEIFIVLFFSGCYAAGGQGPKWVRRFLGSILFGLSLILLAVLTGIRNWQLAPIVIGAAWYCPSLCIFHYGVNDGNTTKKIVLRGIYGGSLGLAGFLVAIGAGNPILGVFQAVVAASSSVYFGVVNPFSNDPKLRSLIQQYPHIGWLQNLPVILEDICIASGCVSFIPFLF